MDIKGLMTYMYLQTAYLIIQLPILGKSNFIFSCEFTLKLSKVVTVFGDLRKGVTSL